METSGTGSGGLSDDQRYAGVDEKKRKRMISNKESARRSRMRKQQVLLALNEQIRVHQEVNKGLEDQINQTWENFMKVESENNVIRAQIKELTDRLQSLTDIVNGNKNNYSGMAATVEMAAAGGVSNSSKNNVASFSDEDKAWVDSLLLLDDIDFDSLVPIKVGVNGGGAGGAGSSSSGSGSGGGGGSSSGGSCSGGGGGGDDMLVEPWKTVSPFQAPPSPAFFEF